MKWLRKSIWWISGALVAGFLFWQIGTAATLQGSQAETAGLLFNKKLPLLEFQRSKEAAIHQLILTSGERNPEATRPEEIEQLAWDRLILIMEARRKGMRVTDQEVIRELQNRPLFQARNGGFDRRSYQALVQYSLHTTPRIFEEEVRDELLIRKLINQVIGNPTVTEQDLLDWFRKKEESIRVSYVTLPDPGLAREIAQASRQRSQELNKALKQLGLKLTASDFFKRNTSLPELGYGADTFGPLFSTEPGQIAGPLRSLKGWLVARLDEKKAADETLFPAQKENLKQEVENQKKMKAYFLWYGDLLKRASPKKFLSGPMRSRGGPHKR